ncbi:CMRF35-like molecule 9 isoform X1 [Balaenoptera acutorostrata]|uniref:CMRF35-like molecule 9 isoform X1 n=1 Tax=Balaenoptera acutorostrata TaxID=9767 RepID=A0A383ZZC9_BALAC|nr:CMRF35-like molecule 9 isoform X1 [Balaenoptera acutorostrata]
MRPLVLLWGCLVLPGYGSLVGPKEISGFEGGTVSLQCTYGEELKKYRKYWCREGGFLISRCSGTVYSGEYGQEGRVSVHDSPRQLRFEVILRNLTLKDMGQYWCGVKRVGFDKTFSVSLLVFPGTSSHPATSPYAGTSPYARTSPYAAALPNAGTSPHPATSPPAGISRQATQLDSTSTEDTNFVPSRSSSKPRVSIPMTRMLAPVLVLLALLLATGLAALGSYMLQWRKKAQLAMETPRKEKVHLSHLPLGNSWVPEYAVIDLAGPTGPPASPKPSASPNVEIQCLSQTSKEDEASWQTPEGDMTPGPPLPVSRDEPDFSKFISV